MQRSRAAVLAAFTSAALVLLAPVAANAAAPSRTAMEPGAATNPSIIVATADAGLSADEDGKVLSSLRSGNDEAAKDLAKSLQSARPDVVVLTGIDVDSSAATVDVLREQYLEKAQDGTQPITYSFVFAPQTNSGVASGADLDGDGTVGGPGDALGHGAFEGQESMVVLSRLPIDNSAVRTFDSMLWKDLPGNHVKQAVYSSLVTSTLPLQSTSLWDVPLTVGSSTIHVLATSATPAGGSEAADEQRHEDQLSFLTRYSSGDASLKSIVDDQGRPGPLAASSRTVVVGSLGADADQSDAGSSSVQSFLDAAGAGTVAPSWGSDRSSEAAPFVWSAPLRKFLDDSARSTRIGVEDSGRFDYVVPSSEMRTLRSGMAKAATDQPTGVSSRLVWVSLSR